MKWRAPSAFIGVLLIASVVLPYIDFGVYRDRVQRALERSLGRKVELSDVEFRILPVPGLTVTNVTIGEDPAIGAEPAAYVGTLRALPSVIGLLRGRLEFSSVDLEDASLNITRVDRTYVDRSDNGVHWSFSPVTQTRTIAALPTIHMRGGRINFKFGDTKSVFYLLDTDVDLWPPSRSNGPWTLRMKAKPARTDRPARGFGSFDLRGVWEPRDNSTSLDVRLEKSELGDMLTLFNGYESGLQGSISGNAHLAGPLSHVGLTGRVTVSNLHGWSQTPPGGNEWPLAIGGVLDAPGQTLDLSARVTAAEIPIDVHYRVADYLRRPRWGVTLNLKSFPLSPLVGIARNIGWNIPAGVRLEGAASGAVSYSMPEGAPLMNGQLVVRNANMSTAGSGGNAPPVRIPTAELRFSGTSATLEPAAILNDQNETATLSADWDSSTRAFHAALSSDGMAIASLGRQISIAGIPVLSQATEGAWSGNIEYSNEEDTGWTGQLHLENTIVPFEAFAQPLRIVAADATIGDSGVSVKHINFALGDLEGRATYDYQTGATRPHRFRVVLSRAKADAVEELLMPALHRGNFFTYAFNFGRAPTPDWLRKMHADGIVQIGALEIGGGEFGSVRSRVVWDGMLVRMTSLHTVFDSAEIAGAAVVQLDRREPAYTVSGKITAMPWRSGALSADLFVASSGTGRNLLANLRAKGSFEGQNIDLTPLDQYDSVAGTFEFLIDRIPRLHVAQLVMKSGRDTYQGAGDTLENGDVVLKISDGTKRIQASGAILQGEALRIAP